ncbi:DUF4340 domain-containing protein [Zongyangia hominis]|uniref:DUF4340 domain-containing protein n=1 Tax=Zongyangia hominis TaxID=2763677 RepID=A0A926EFC1_9FIRM|nr:DUF4340 domain-containing protein [Zongyangia hominis]MBC8571444.1 DUF4340 domain-containing protein [Zongyangia hominis]
MSKGKWNKKAVGLLAGLVVVAVLTVTAVFFLRTPAPGEEESGSSESGQSIVLSNQATENVVSVQIQVAYGDYTVQVDENGDAYIEELSGYPRNENGLYSVLADASNITAKQLVEENPGDVEKYGLKDPLSVATITYKDGSVFVLKVGDTAPQNRGVYVQTQDGNVYLMDEYNIYGLISPMTEYVERRLVPPLESSTEVVESCKTAGLKKITIGGALREQPIEITFDKESGTFYMVSPVKRRLSEEGIDKLGGIFGVYASHVVNLEPTAQDITAAGLDDPETLITLEYADQTLALRLDGKDKDLLSAMRSDVNILYDLDMSTISFMEYTYTDLLADAYIVDSQDEIASLEITLGGKTYTLVPGDAPTLNGAAVEAEPFAQMMEMALSARSEGERTQKVSGEPEMVMTVRLKDQAREPEVLKFYYDGVRSYDVDCNGSITSYIKASFVEKLGEALEALSKGESFSVSW